MLLKVAVVDDEKLFREYLMETMDWASLQSKVCWEAKDGVEALEKALIEPPDLVLVDVNMPFMDGLTFTEKLKERLPNVQVVLVTGLETFDCARKAIQLGVKDYLLKPFSNEEFDVTISKIQKEFVASSRETSVKSMTPIEAGRSHFSIDQTDRKPLRSDLIVEKAIAVIHEQYGNETLSLDYLCKLVYVNESYFRSVFKKKTGIPVSDYITQVRMNKAKECIESGGQKFSEIGYGVGYKDPAYFSKCFKKYFGMSPSVFETMHSKYKKASDNPLSQSSEPCILKRQ
jgi:two-component system response regulator YesN